MIGMILAFTGLEIAAIVSLVASTAATGYGVYANNQATKAQAKQAELNAEAERDRMEKEAEQEKLNRRENEKQERTENKRRRAAMEAAYAKSGVLLDGTPENYLVDQAQVDEQNIQQANLESKQRGLGLKHRGDVAYTEGMNQSAALKSKAQSDLIGGSVGLVGGAAGKTATYGSEFDWFE